MDYKTQFLEFAIEQGVLRFGRFTLKSGRISPYFFNAGLFNRGAALAKLGQYYAQAVQASELQFDMLFGPAYKGIPLVTATAIAFSEHYARDFPYAFNRKEVKSYGEGGKIIGTPLSGKVLIIDDVITAGTAIREAVEIIHAEGAEPVGVAISLDRQERGQDKNSAIQEVEQKLGLKVISIVGLEDLVAYVGKKPEFTDQLGAIKAYQREYGV